MRLRASFIRGQACGEDAHRKAGLRRRNRPTNYEGVAGWAKRQGRTYAYPSPYLIIGRSKADNLFWRDPRTSILRFDRWPRWALGSSFAPNAHRY